MVTSKRQKIIKPPITAKRGSGGWITAGIKMAYQHRKSSKNRSKPQSNRRKLLAYLVLAVAVAALVFFERIPIEHALDRLYQLAGLHTTSPTLGGEELRVHFIDVGQGLSILIQTPEQNILYDSGESDEEQAVTAYLRAQGVQKVDLAIASHPHTDHIGALYPLTQTFRVKQVIVPEIPEEILPNHNAWGALEDAFAYGELTPVTAVPGDVYDLGGGVQMTFLAPQPGAEYDSLNLYSVVCRIDYGDDSFLLTGDMEAPNELELLDTLGADEVRTDVLSLAHHGSKTSSTARWLDAVAPEFAVASTGRDNDYGHPHSGVVKRLKQRGIPFYNTAQDGSVVFSSFGDGVRLLDAAPSGEKSAA